MNSENHEIQSRPLPHSSTGRQGTSNELETLKHDLLKAEVKLARARATIAGAEVDVKVLTTRLKVLSK